MARGQKQSKAPSARDQRHQPRGAIQKKAAPPSALAAAIAARKRQPHTAASASTTASSISLLLDAELAESDIQSDQLVQLVRECMDEAADERIALSELGGLVRARAMRQCLHTADGFLHKQVKAKWGGWEGFVRAHAADEFVVLNGLLLRRPTMTVQEAPLALRRAPDVGHVKPDELGLQALNVLGERTTE